MSANNKKFIINYNENIINLLKKLDVKKIFSIKEHIIKTKKNGGKVILFGNGGSASTSDHIAVDLTKNANIRASSFNNSSLITCLSNDYGYDQWMEKAIKYYVDKNDIIILISASGNSKNLLKAANFCKKYKLKLITLTGFKKNNKLSKKGMINLWINSMSYNIVEILHFIILANIVDLIIGKKIYKSNVNNKFSIK